MTPSQSVYTRTLSHAVRIAGGDERLAFLLGASSTQLAEWLCGAEQIPVDVFLKAVDLLMERDRDVRGPIRSLPMT
jgi:hypothetical protein